MKSIKEYLSRIGKARGFGIQSPWAYRFVTEVIAETWPYYIYEDINKRYTTKKERKYHRLLFRVKNFMTPNHLVIKSIDNLNVDKYQSLCTSKDALIVTGIYNDKCSSEKWKKFYSRDDVGIVFDLYDFAICFFDLSMIKQYYKLNF